MFRTLVAVGLIATATTFNAAAVTPPNPAGIALYGKDVSAEHIGGQLDMTDQNGRRRKLSDFRGKVVLIFFGYTRCPDVCPTTLSNLARVMNLLGPDADKSQVLWVTVDPERDTAEILRNYVPNFNPKFIALRGSAAKTDALARRFHVNYQILEYQGATLVDHSAYGYLIDTSGKTRVKLLYDLTAEQIAADVQKFLTHD
ncbi:SCO family protein [Rhodoferax sp.]|uniref:SCO family protein n=1 Tax=Rhodoferax sp. TaxID=50421 RepID=UPI00284E3DCC|nr:SCO family protein [Rhodoferax sp.]MDR3370132.1 SCO family protein [Rhodoferax sp.]